MDGYAISAAFLQTSPLPEDVHCLKPLCYKSFFGPQERFLDRQIARPFRDENCAPVHSPNRSPDPRPVCSSTDPRRPSPHTPRPTTVEFLRSSRPPPFGTCPRPGSRRRRSRRATRARSRCSVRCRTLPPSRGRPCRRRGTGGTRSARGGTTTTTTRPWLCLVVTVSVGAV